MRLDCWTQVGYRMMECQNPHSKSKKAAFTVVVLSRMPAREKSPNPVTFIVVCTSAKPSGAKYRVTGNVERLFTNFVDEGKATIRIREPMHDLIISKADVAELRQFLTLLRRVMRGEKLDQSLFSAPPGKVVPVRLKMVVCNRSQYPASGFPSTLQKLTIQCCNLTRIGRDVLTLENLVFLNVNDNKLKTLPKELNALPLRHLVALTNEIEVLPAELFGRRLRNSLEFLDLSSNRLTVLPDTLSSLPKLTALVARNNSLKKLPDALGFTPSLCILDVTNNELAYLPASLMQLALDWISVWNNPLSRDLPVDAPEEDASRQQPLSLLDLAAQATLHVTRKRRLTAEDVPATVLEWLHTATPCHGCKRLVLPATAFSVTSRVNLRMTTGPTALVVREPFHDICVPMRALLCSSNCLRR